MPSTTAAEKATRIILLGNACTWPDGLQPIFWAQRARRWVTRAISFWECWQSSQGTWGAVSAVEWRLYGVPSSALHTTNSPQVTTFGRASELLKGNLWIGFSWSWLWAIMLWPQIFFPPTFFIGADYSSIGLRLIETWACLSCKSNSVRAEAAWSRSFRWQTLGIAFHKKTKTKTKKG